mgnify:CR=1 FL=1
MKENLVKAITEELEFECEVGDYKVSCQSADTNRLIISIIDNDNEFDVTTADSPAPISDNISILFSSIKHKIHKYIC